MGRSNDEMPHIELLEALASCPYLVKAAIAEARGGDSADGGACASAADLAEIETALTLLRVSGWRDGEAQGRAPLVRRNLLLLHVHLHRERMRQHSGTDAAPVIDFDDVAGPTPTTPARAVVDLAAFAGDHA